VAGRALAFADPEIIRMAKEDYVAVTGDDWYQRRRQDAEGEFFRKVADQGPRKGQGGSTRQGIYMLTAGGKLLGYKNAGQAPDVMRETLQRGLAEWKKLPATERQPGTVTVPDAEATDRRFVRSLPPGGLAINVFTRVLDRDSQRKYTPAKLDAEWGSAPARDHLWLMPDEVEVLTRQSTLGQSIELPAKLVERLVRFHLIDNTRGEPPLWSREDVRKCDLRLTCKSLTKTGQRLMLEGTVLLANHADEAKATRGYEARLLGFIEVDGAKVKSVELVAIGEHWGEGTYTRGARPGRTPLGVYFELTSGKSPADQVPPQGAREWQEYVGSRR
jgi:hypothetical protein